MQEKREEAKPLALKRLEEQKRIEAGGIAHTFQMDKLRSELEILQKQMQDERHQLHMVKADQAVLQLRASSMSENPPVHPPIKPRFPRIRRLSISCTKPIVIPLKSSNT